MLARVKYTAWAGAHAAALTGSIRMPLRFVTRQMCAMMQQAAVAGGSLVETNVVGTYGYMAPEQIECAAEPASDLYALGATLLFLLSGVLHAGPNP